MPRVHAWAYFAALMLCVGACSDAAPPAPALDASLDAGADDRFGWAVALSSDGSRLAVGAPYEASSATGIGGDQTNDAAGFAGAVYVY